MNAKVFHPDGCRAAQRLHAAPLGGRFRRRAGPTGLWVGPRPGGPRTAARGRADRSLWDASDEAALIRRCNEGDEKAWEQLYGRYAGTVSRVARRYCSRASRDPEDLVQEVFLHLFKALKEFDSARPLDPFVLEIARKVCISGLRRDAAEKRGGRNPGHLSLDHSDTVHEKGPLEVSSDADDAETALMKAQEVRLLRNALSLLSDACRRLLELRYERGLSYAEMTESTDVREGTLRVQVLRCLSALGREYERLIDHREVRR